MGLLINYFLRVHRRWVPHTHCVLFVLSVQLHLLVNDILIETKLARDSELIGSLRGLVSVDDVSLSCGVAYVGLSHVHLWHLFVLLLLFELVEVAHNVSYGLFVHGHSLLKDMKRPWNDVKLGYNFLKGLGKLFATSSDTSIWGFLGVAHVGSSTFSTLWLRWRDIGSLSSWCFCTSGSFRSWWPSWSNWWDSSYLLVVSLFGSEIFDELLIIFFKVTLPDHDNRVCTTSCEVITAWRECSGGWSALVTIKSVKNMTLSQVPNFDRRVITSRQEVSSVWMEINLIYICAMGIVMLDKPLTSDIPNFDGLIRAATSNTSTIRMEPNWVHLWVVINKLVDQLSWWEIPKLHTFIVRSRSNKAGVWRELAWSNEIMMRLRDCEQEFIISSLMHFQILIIWAWEQKLSIEREINRSDSSWMGFDHLRVSLNSVVPDSNGVISWTGCNHVSRWRYFNIMDWTFVANESERSHSWLEVPNHNSSIFRAWNGLFEIWVECNSANSVFVSFEWSFKSWISLRGSTFLWHI